VPHRFEVVEDDCIGCGLCSERAPENFEVPRGSNVARVIKQPGTSEEEEACLEAHEYCPIGGLHAHAVDCPPADSANGTCPTAAAAGPTTTIAAVELAPVDITQTRLES